MKAADSNKRAPRVFNLEKVVEPPNSEPLPTGPGSGPVKKSSEKRKPRTVPEQAILKRVPDEAAQRFEPGEIPAEALLDQLTPPPPVASHKPFGWSKLFWSALAGLISLALGFWIDQLIRDLFARQDWLGWLAVALTGALVLAALVLILKEFLGFRRMARIDLLREKAAKAAADDDIEAARSTIKALIQLYDNRPDTAAGRGALEAHDGEIIDGKNLIALAERDLMRPLDLKARALVMGSAKRVSVVTAISPRALVDVGFVLVENMRLMRRIADLYGGRPGTLGFWRLARNIISHLAVTGSIAVGDGLLQQLVGHGLAAKISARLGEGVVNGLLTARIGIAAMDVCRPLPFSDQVRPGARDFLAELTRFSGKEEE